MRKMSTYSQEKDLKEEKTCFSSRKTILVFPGIYFEVIQFLLDPLKFSFRKGRNSISTLKLFSDFFYEKGFLLDFLWIVI